MFLNSDKIQFESLPSPGEKFQLQDIIGEGTYGEVYAAIDLEIEANLNLKDVKNRTRDSKVAIKILDNLHENLEEAEEELLVLRDLSIHPNLPSFYGLYFKRASNPEDCQLWYVMELCSGGTVTDLAKGLKKFEGRKLTEMQIAYILREVVDALTHLHIHHCVHRDVKGHNILLTGDARVKLVDFGVAAQLKDTYDRRNTSIGTPYWMGPEVIACERKMDISYDFRCDVWSLGITAIELTEGEPPLAGLHPMRALFQIPRNPPPTLRKPHDWSRDFNDFIAECLVKDLDQRPFIVELSQHPFLRTIDRIPEDIIRRGLAREIQLIKAHGDLLTREPEVTTKHGKLKSDRKSKLHTMFVDDLVLLTTPDEETILNQLCNRFHQKQPYTYIGDMLIALNPYEDLGIYNEFYQFKYRAVNTSDVPPHIFSLANRAYHSMVHQKRQQNVIITGDSGAGKSENVKYLLQHLMYLGKAPNRDLESKILHVDHIMEAFGNAATGMNHNSSRFAKYLEVAFTRTGKIIGAKLYIYLLEKSRVDKQRQGERNFHIFYYLLHGLQRKGRGQEFKLDKSPDSYLQRLDDSPEIEEKNVENFEAVNNAFHLLGFHSVEIESLYKVLIAILHLGEVQFDTGSGEEYCSVQNMEGLETVANLLGVSTEDLNMCLTTRSVILSGETFTLRNNCAEATTCRDSLAREIYNGIFQWIVCQINALLGITRLTFGEPLSIGLLDIFGFASFQENTFEQLCINITNEKLQYLFNQHVFIWEQQEYMADGINIEVVPYADNRPILDICLGKPLGILSLTDEESHFPHDTDRTLIEKLNETLHSNRFYFPSKSKDLSFQIRHYSGKVEYSVKGFVEKNRNVLSPGVIQTLRKSTNDIVKTICMCFLIKHDDLYLSNLEDGISEQMQKEEEMEETSQTRNISAVTSFRFSLTDLMCKLLCGQLHFVRCIKPNDFVVPDQFDPIKVLQQLRCSGLLDTLRIRQLGYSHHFTFAEFLKSYCFLAFNFDERVVADKETCRLLLLRLKLDNWALGKTKVFLKYYHVEYLAKLCEQQIRSVIFVQACVRRWLAKIRFRNNGMWQVAKTVISTQRAAKTWVKVGKRFSKITSSEEPNKRRRTMSVILSKVFREEILIDEDHRLSDEEKAAILIQSNFRGFRTRKKLKPMLEESKDEIPPHENRHDHDKALCEEEEAAVVLQRFFRRWKITHQGSQETGEEEKESNRRNKSRIKLDNWDAPFRIMESHMKDVRAGRIRYEKVNMADHRREMILAGLQSQDLANQEREKLVAGKWQDVINKAGKDNDSSEEIIELFKKPANVPQKEHLGKFGKIKDAYKKKVQTIEKPSVKSGNMTNMCESLKATPKSPVIVEISTGTGFEDFRKHLRKTDHRPTDFP